jgi:hypothetical protein
MARVITRNIGGTEYIIDTEEDPAETAIAQSLEQIESDDEEENNASAFVEPDPKKLDEVFKLEKADPRHRMGNYLYLLKLEYDKQGQRLPFYSWVDGITFMSFKKIISDAIAQLRGKDMEWWNNECQKFQAGVKYKGEDARGKHLIHIEGGLIKRRGRMGPGGKWMDTGKIEPFTTTGFRSHWSGDGWAIWVESKSRQFYSNRMKVGRFQHSSFLAGKAVRGAGEWVVTDGYIQKISGRSGHYKGKIDHLLGALRDLAAQNVVLMNTDVAVFSRIDNSPVIVKAPTLLAMPFDQARGRYKVDPLEW